MKLEPIATPTVAERLMRRELGGCQKHATNGNFKNIAVPMRCSENFRQFTRKEIFFGLRTACHRKKTNLFAVGTPHLGAQCARDKLPPQTETKDGFLSGQSGSHQCALPIKIRIQISLVGALPTATENETIKFRGIERQDFTNVGMKNAQPYPKVTKHFGKKPRLVHIPMLNEKNIFHTGKDTMPDSRVKPKKAGFNRISALPSSGRMEKLRPVRPDCRPNTQHHAQTFKPYAKCHR